MSLANFAAAKLALLNPSQRIEVTKLFTLTSGQGWSSLWLGTGAPAAGSTPSTAAACTGATAGGLGQSAPSGSNELRMWLRRFALGASAANFSMMVADRLVHAGGLDATVITAQAVSAVALPRYTSGFGVMAALEIYTAVGATATTVTMTYVNQAGATKTSQPVDFGGAGQQSQGRFIPISLALGDTGVRSVTSVTVLATTGTAGNFGVTLYRPLVMYGVSGACTNYVAGHAHPIADYGGYAMKVETGACLFFIARGLGTSVLTLNADVCFFED